jgi:hypothetical protein
MIGRKIDGLNDVKGWAQKFEQGLHNASGARIGQDTTADDALATHNNARAILHFDGFKAKIIGDVPVKKYAEEQEDASLALALQLQLEDEAALRREQEEAASLRLIEELQVQDRRNYRF